MATKHFAFSVHEALRWTVREFLPPVGMLVLLIVALSATQAEALVLH